MIYAAGYTFTVGGTTSPMSGGSVIQQLAETKKNKNVSNSLFKSNKEYVLYHIVPIKEEKSLKFKYIFQDRETHLPIEMIFLNTVEADTFIARISGKLQNYQNERKKLETIADTF